MKPIFYRLNGRTGGGYTLANEKGMTTNIHTGAKVEQSRLEFLKFIKKMRKFGNFTLEKL